MQMVKDVLGDKTANGLTIGVLAGMGILNFVSFITAQIGDLIFPVDGAPDWEFGTFLKQLIISLIGLLLVFMAASWVRRQAR